MVLVEITIKIGRVWWELTRIEIDGTEIGKFLLYGHIPNLKRLTFITEVANNISRQYL